MAKLPRVTAHVLQQPTWRLSELDCTKLSAIYFTFFVFFGDLKEDIILSGL
jgi:hypothetical protein